MYLSSVLGSRGPSSLITPTYHNIIDPEDVEVEDSEDEIPERVTREPSTGKIGSFKTKLIRRLSHRADAKANSQASIGTSNEELARRAELKRLMHKRIQQELKSEEEEEEDDIRLPSPKQPSINNCKEPELPGGGPRDTIEFSMSGIDELETGTMLETPIPPAPVINGSQESHRRRSSCPESLNTSITTSPNNGNVPVTDMGSVTQSPLSTHLIPVHPFEGGGRESPSAASFCLSYNAGHLDSPIQPLEEATQAFHPHSSESKNSSSSTLAGDTTNQQQLDSLDCSNLTTQDETIDTSQTMQIEHIADLKGKNKEQDISTSSDEMDDGRHSPLDMWLRSQDLQYTSILSSRSNSEMALECLNEANSQAKHDVRAQQLDNSTDLSRHKSQTVDSPPALQLNAPGAWPKSPKASSDTKPSIATPSNESMALHQILSQMRNSLAPDALFLEDQVRDVSSRYTSSRYTTRPNSQQATPRGSRLSLTEQLGSRRALQQLPAIDGEFSYNLGISLLKLIRIRAGKFISPNSQREFRQ
jgi:hypothetical protein